MIKSMTGYGKSEQTIDSLNVTVEIKSVNHRYFEFSARVPREYGFLEEKLKKYCNSLITREKSSAMSRLRTLKSARWRLMSMKLSPPAMSKR